VNKLTSQTPATAGLDEALAKIVWTSKLVQSAQGGARLHAASSALNASLSNLASLATEACALVAADSALCAGALSSSATLTLLSSVWESGCQSASSASSCAHKITLILLSLYWARDATQNRELCAWLDGNARNAMRDECVQWQVMRGLSLLASGLNESEIAVAGPRLSSFRGVSQVVSRCSLQQTPSAVWPNFSASYTWTIGSANGFAWPNTLASPSTRLFSARSDRVLPHGSAEVLLLGAPRLEPQSTLSIGQARHAAQSSAAGYYLNENGTLQLCEIGFFCPGDNASYPCFNGPPAPEAEFTRSGETTADCEFRCTGAGLVRSENWCVEPPVGWYAVNGSQEIAQCSTAPSWPASAAIFVSPGRVTGSAVSCAWEPLCSIAMTEAQSDEAVSALCSRGFSLTLDISLSISESLAELSDLSVSVGLDLAGVSGLFMVALVLPNSTADFAWLQLELAEHRQMRSTLEAPRSIAISRRALENRSTLLTVSAQPANESISFHVNATDAGRGWVPASYWNCSSHSAGALLYVGGSTRHVENSTQKPAALYSPRGELSHFSLLQIESLGGSDFDALAEASARQRACNGAVEEWTGLACMPRCPGLRVRDSSGQCLCPWAHFAANEQATCQPCPPGAILASHPQRSVIDCRCSTGQALSASLQRCLHLLQQQPDVSATAVASSSTFNGSANSTAGFKTIQVNATAPAGWMLEVLLVSDLDGIQRLSVERIGPSGRSALRFSINASVTLRVALLSPDNSSISVTVEREAFLILPALPPLLIAGSFSPVSQGPQVIMFQPPFVSTAFELLFTTDDADPAVAASVQRVDMSTPIVIAPDTVLRAFARHPGFVPSPEIRLETRAPRPAETRRASSGFLEDARGTCAVDRGRCAGAALTSGLVILLTVACCGWLARWCRRAKPGSRRAPAPSSSRESIVPAARESVIELPAIAERG
jgi:hypothetical protein